MELILFLIVWLGFTLLGAVTQNPITGRTKNKYGPAVFSKWKDLNTMRTKPVQVANPDTLAQGNARGKFSYMSKLARDLGSWLDFGFDSFYSSMTRRNAYMKLNLVDVDFVNRVYDDYAMQSGNQRTGRNPQTGATIQIAAKLTELEITIGGSYPAEYNPGTLDIIAINSLTGVLLAQGSIVNPVASATPTLAYLAGKTALVGNNVMYAYSWRSVDGTLVDRSQGGDSSATS